LKPNEKKKNILRQSDRINWKTKYYQHINRGQSLNDFELNQNPELINQPYCKKKKNKPLTL
jgi:hypothetical protein